MLVFLLGVTSRKNQNFPKNASLNYEISSKSFLLYRRALASYINEDSVRLISTPSINPPPPNIVLFVPRQLCDDYDTLSLPLVHNNILYNIVMITITMMKLPVSRRRRRRSCLYVTTVIMLYSTI